VRGVGTAFSAHAGRFAGRRLGVSKKTRGHEAAAHSRTDCPESADSGEAGA